MALFKHWQIFPLLRPGLARNRSRAFVLGLSRLCPQVHRCARANVRGCRGVGDHDLPLVQFQLGAATPFPRPAAPTPPAAPLHSRVPSARAGEAARAEERAAVRQAQHRRTTSTRLATTRASRHRDVRWIWRGQRVCTRKRLSSTAPRLRALRSERRTRTARACRAAAPPPIPAAPVSSGRPLRRCRR